MKLSLRTLDVQVAALHSYSSSMSHPRYMRR